MNILPRNKPSLRRAFAVILCVAAFSAPASAIIGAATAYAANTTAATPQTQYTLLQPLPCIPGGGITCSGNTGNSVSYMSKINVEQYVTYMINLAIAIAAAAAVFMITLGGFEMMTSVSVTKHSEGLDRVKNAVYGLVLILSSYVILRTIDPRLVAVPTTLVTPLTVNVSSQTDSLLQSQLDQINQIAQQTGAAYQSSMDKARASVAAYDTQAQQLQSLQQGIEDQIADALPEGQGESGVDIDSICAQASQPGGDAGINSLCVQRANLVSQQQGVKASAQTVIAQAALDSQVQGDNPNSKAVTTFDDAKNQADLRSQYQAQLAALQQAGATSDQLNSLTSYYTYSSEMLNVYETLNPVLNLEKTTGNGTTPGQLGDAENTALKNLDSLQTAYAAIGNVDPKPDPALVAQFNQNIQTAKSQVQAIQQKTNTTNASTASENAQTSQDYLDNAMTHIQ